VLSSAASACAAAPTHATTKARSPLAGLGKLEDDVGAELKLPNVERDGRVLPRERGLPAPALLGRAGEAVRDGRQVVNPIVTADDQHRVSRWHIVGLAWPIVQQAVLAPLPGRDILST
jgi:hypothetical protein